MLKLFHCPNVCSIASLIALEEAEADFEVMLVDFRSGEQDRPEFRAINPKGRVPALVTDEGVLTESPAIMSPSPSASPLLPIIPVGPACRPSNAVPRKHLTIQWPSPCRWC